MSANWPGHDAAPDERWFDRPDANILSRCECEWSGACIPRPDLPRQHGAGPQLLLLIFLVAKLNDHSSLIFASREHSPPWARHSRDHPLWAVRAGHEACLPADSERIEPDIMGSDPAACRDDTPIRVWTVYLLGATKGLVKAFRQGADLGLCAWTERSWAGGCAHWNRLNRFSSGIGRRSMS